jgi:hypothetical protein
MSQVTLQPACKQVLQQDFYHSRVFGLLQKLNIPVMHKGLGPVWPMSAAHFIQTSQNQKKMFLDLVCHLSARHYTCLEVAAVF